MPPQTATFAGLLHLDGPRSFLVTKDSNGNSVFTLMMLCNSPTCPFDRAAVAAARNHFVQRGLPEGSPIRVLGFVTDEDVNGTGVTQPVLHIVKDLG
jgi:hypothetical protein